MPMYEFGCPAGHVTEKRVTDYGLYEIMCQCGQPAHRSTVNQINFGGYASTPGKQRDYSQDYRRFTEASSEIDYKASSVEYNEGTKVDTSHLFKTAKVQAAKLADAGVKADQIRT